MGERSLGWEFLDRFATAIASTVPLEEGRALRAMAFEVIAEEEAEEIALRHLASATGSSDRRRALGAIFEETAELFRARTEHLE
jgi:hypothetical protein